MFFPLTAVPFPEKAAIFCKMAESEMKLIFMGTPEFASVSLRAVAEKHTVLMAVCRPDKPAGRGGKVSSPAVKTAAKKLSIPVFQPENVGELAADFEKLKPDAVCVVAYGKMIPPDMLTLARHGFINLHASLLPLYRGAAPINRAVMEGKKKTGVTTMMIDKNLDSGDILLQKEIIIKDDENSEELSHRMAQTGAELLVQTLARVEKGDIEPKPQNHSAATYAPMLAKKDGRIDWKKTAEEIKNQTRGTLPWPGAFTIFGGKILKILKAEISTGNGKPGEVLRAEKTLVIAAGTGAVEIKEVQLEGKRKMPAGDFLRGVKLETGWILCV